MKLDLSGLQRIAYNGLDTEEERAAKDSMVERGFTLTDEKTPFDSAERTGSAAEAFTAPEAAAVPAESKNASEGRKTAAAAPTPLPATQQQRYKAIFRDAYNLLERYAAAPEELTTERWKQITDEVIALADKHKSDLAIGMMAAIVEELERITDTKA